MSALGFGSCEPPAEPSAIAPVRETAPVPHGGDAADDAAIWVNRADRAKSTIIATDKKGGLAVYGLDGSQIQFLADGHLNNVDLRDGFRLGGRTVTLVAAGNRSGNQIAVYRVDERTRRLVDVAAGPLPTRIAVNGSCMYRSAVSGDFFYFETSTAGRVQQWRLVDEGGLVDAVRVRTFEVGSQAEACVADDELGDLYVADEKRGIWKYSAEPTAGTARVRVDSTGSGGHLAADVEGLAIATDDERAGYLVASSQGNDSFVVYRREGRNRYVGTFEVEAGNGVDAVEETDGIDVSSANLGSPFAGGVFVAQDGYNDRGNQNFKLVSWRSVVSRIT